MAVVDSSSVKALSCRQIKGTVVNPIKFSLSRGQYEQMLETVDTVLMPGESSGEKTTEERPVLENILEESELNPGVSTLSMDPTLRARMMAHGAGQRALTSSPTQSISLTGKYNYRGYFHG